MLCCSHSQPKRSACSGLMKTALNNVLLPTLFNVVNNIVQYCLQSGVTMLNNIVDNLEQNVGSKTLFNAVFIRPEQVVRFLLCCLDNIVNIFLHCNDWVYFLQSGRKALASTIALSFLHDWLYFIIWSTLLEVQRKTEDERKEYAKECENMRRCATPR